MELLHINPFKLAPNPWNSNKVGRAAFEKLKQSLTKHGAFKPIVVRELADGTLEILGGYHRNEAVKELGWEEVPVLNLGKVSEDRAKEIGLIDNTRYGEDDKELLDKLLAEMDLDSLDATLPDGELFELTPEDTELEEMLEEGVREVEEKEDTHRTIKIRLELDEADEVEDLLLKVAADHDYKFSDGYSDFGKALYHILFLEKR